jgi:hypothetical protein
LLRFHNLSPGAAPYYTRSLRYFHSVESGEVEEIGKAGMNSSLRRETGIHSYRHLTVSQSKQLDMREEHSLVQSFAFEGRGKREN